MTLLSLVSLFFFLTTPACGRSHRVRVTFHPRKAFVMNSKQKTAASAYDAFVATLPARRRAIQRECAHSAPAPVPDACEARGLDKKHCVSHVKGPVISLNACEQREQDKLRQEQARLGRELMLFSPTRPRAAGASSR
jgi:hypothetical protein